MIVSGAGFAAMDSSVRDHDSPGDTRVVQPISGRATCDVQYSKQKEGTHDDAEPVMARKWRARGRGALFGARVRAVSSPADPTPPDDACGKAHRQCRCQRLEPR